VHDRYYLDARGPDAVDDAIREAENPATANVTFNDTIEQRRLLNPTDRIEHGCCKATPETGGLGLIVLGGLNEFLAG